MNFLQTPIPPLARTLAVMLFWLATATSADDSAQIHEMERQISLLKDIVAEQGARIRKLELLQGTTPTQSRSSEAGSISATRPPWHDPKAWSRLKTGMSEAQIVSILGRPTSVERISFHRLIYRGEVAGSGYVTGSVSLHNEQLFTISEPVFNP